MPLQLISPVMITGLKQKYRRYYALRYSAVREGFEPPDLLQSTVFKTAAFDHSAISPGAKLVYLNNTSKIIFRFYFPGQQ